MTEAQQYYRDVASMRPKPRSQTNRRLIDELCHLFHSKRVGMMCALAHGQVTIDGYVVRPQHLDRWTRDQLQGRYARCVGRTAQLYGSKVVGP